MAEQLELTDPITTAPVTTATYRVVSMRLDLEAVASPTPTPDPGIVQIVVRDNNGAPTQCQYLGAEAIELMKWLNTANFSVNSMQKRVLQKLTSDGQLPSGTVTGTPDRPADDPDGEVQ